MKFRPKTLTGETPVNTGGTPAPLTDHGSCFGMRVYSLFLSANG